ncbi:MAG TPA: sn-glycerol-1-phosphate dehydrogenase [Candidatus Blautia excrementipullorum]|nr:sn-glycerol-1-phosphate dehydrogenase [Candidatus Blautia excrementipullorum]
MRVDTDDFGRPCSCGKEHHIEVKEIIIEEGAAEKLEEAMSDGFLKQYISPLLICDTNTCKATEEIMEDIYDRCQVLVLDAEGLHADEHAVEIVENYMDEDIDLILAVGSGTIHDISRYIACQYKIPFISVPTAASVDGFVSNVAAMTWKGLKKTVPAVPPMAVFADTAIFAEAPKRLTASGISDLFGKYICLADWKIAHLLTGEYICSRIIELEEKALRTVSASLRGIAQGDPEGCEELMYALILSGLAMQMVGNSRPASCAEHHLSHLWEMEVINGKLDALHGEKVSVGTLLVLNRYKQIARAVRNGECTVIPYEDLDAKLRENTFGKRGLLEGIRKENDPEPLLEVSPSRLRDRLSAIADIIEELPDEKELTYAMDLAGCRKSVYDIGLTEDIIPVSLRLAPYVRRRLSFLRVTKMLKVEGEA